jgi:hypothetical protein
MMFRLTTRARNSDQSAAAFAVAGPPAYLWS